jgi:ABC-type antimicrobial peptide transport system permease subunit
VVGIVAGLATSPLRGSPTSTAFVPLRHGSRRDWYVRYREPGGPTFEAARRVAQAVEPRALLTLGPAVDPIAVQLARPRFLATLLGTLAALALLLAALGLTGVVTHAVGRRRREIGIRRALGADLGNVTRLVVARSLKPAAVGVGAGLGAAWWASGLLSSQLHGVEPGDPATYLAAALLVIGVVVCAAAVPARRAGRVDPRDVLIGE